MFLWKYCIYVLFIFHKLHSTGTAFIICTCHCRNFYCVLLLYAGPPVIASSSVAVTICICCRLSTLFRWQLKSPVVDRRIERKEKCGDEWGILRKFKGNRMNRSSTIRPTNARSMWTNIITKRFWNCCRKVFVCCELFRIVCLILHLQCVTTSKALNNESNAFGFCIVFVEIHSTPKRLTWVKRIQFLLWHHFFLDGKVNSPKIWWFDRN